MRVVLIVVLKLGAHIHKLSALQSIGEDIKITADTHAKKLQEINDRLKVMAAQQAEEHQQEQARQERGMNTILDFSFMNLINGFFQRLWIKSVRKLVKQKCVARNSSAKNVV